VDGESLVGLRMSDDRIKVGAEMLVKDADGRHHIATKIKRGWATMVGEWSGNDLRVIPDITEMVVMYVIRE
jgi:hypothetical protein